MNGNTLYFDGDKHALSHRFPTPLYIGGTKFETVEHVFRYYKALAAHNMPQCDNIMVMRGDPEYLELFACKAFLPQKQWDSVKWWIMYRLSYEKFKNGELRKILLQSRRKYLVENSEDLFWGIGSNGEGRNETGRILALLRKCFSSSTPAFPPVLFVGDSLIKNIDVDDALIVPIPGGKQEFVKTAASAISNDSIKCLIIMCGTNDLVCRKDVEPGQQPELEKRLKPVNLLAKVIWKWAVAHTALITDQTVVICTIPPRTLDVGENIPNKISKHKELLVNYKKSSNSQMIRIFDVGAVIDESDLSDGLHFSRKGSAKLSSAFFEIIKSVCSNAPSPPYLF